jgi:hypothetical protein
MRRFGIAAFAAVTSMTISGAATAQPFEQCKGPFAKCVTEIGGWCESNGKGGQRIVYYDKSSAASRFEQCIGRVFEEHGKPNPYKPASSQAAPKR